MKRDTSIFIISCVVILGIFVLILLGGKFVRVEVTQPMVEFNGYTFTKVGNFWYFDWFDGNQSFNVPLRYNPLEVVDVEIKGKLDDVFNNASEIYITFDPLAEQEDFQYLALAAGELGFSMNGAIGVTPIAACIVNATEACTARPIVSCDDVDKAVIYLKVPKNESQSGVYFVQNCVVLVGKEMGLLKAVDRLLYNWFGVLV